MNVLLIIPAYNEEQSIVKVCKNLEENFSEYDYVVINDGSSDSTETLCKANGFPVISLPINLGLAGAFQTGVKYAFRKGYDCAVQFDGDGQHKPEYIRNMLDVLENGEADVVIGSRFVTKKKPFTLRMLGSHLIVWAMKCTIGRTVKDPTSGMRLFGPQILKDIAYGVNYGPEPDTIAYLMRKGVRIKEIQVEMDEREAGDSYLNFTRSLLYMLRMMVSLFFIQNFRR